MILRILLACCALFSSATVIAQSELPLPGITYAGYHPGQSPLTGVFPSTEEVRQDMDLLSCWTSTVRTYSTIAGDVEAAYLAADAGLTVIAGAWISRTPTDNRHEVERLLRQADSLGNKISHLLVGNEVLLRKDLPEEALYELLDEVRARASHPVSSAETWDNWLRYPKLARHVDFLAVHVLPYWENVPVEQAAQHAIDSALRVKAAYPDKPILVVETGWPTYGETREAAVPSPEAQMRYLKDFNRLAKAAGLEYLVIEAFDQPWKAAQEGVVGAHWGVLTANRMPKKGLERLAALRSQTWHADPSVCGNKGLHSSRPLRLSYHHPALNPSGTGYVNSR